MYLFCNYKANQFNCLQFLLESIFNFFPFWFSFWHYPVPFLFYFLRVWKPCFHVTISFIAYSCIFLLLDVLLRLLRFIFSYKLMLNSLIFLCGVSLKNMNASLFSLGNIIVHHFFTRHFRIG